MGSITLHCTNCGAAVEIPDTVRFATCNQCGTTLRVQSQSDEATTPQKALSELKAKTDTLASDVEVVKLQKEIELLDREWEARKQQLGISALEQETERPPDPKRLLIGAGTLLLIAAALVIIGATRHVAAASTIALIPALAACGILVLMLRAPKVAAYLREKQSYRTRRAKLSQQLGLAWQQSSKNNDGLPESPSAASPPSRTQR